MPMNHKQFPALIATCLAVVAFIGAAGARGPVPAKAPEAKKTVTDAAKVQLELGSLYEAYGRLAEAEAAYSKAASEGSGETSNLARVALGRVVAQRGAIRAEWQIQLGDDYRKLGRFMEAEAAYGKALDGGTAVVRAQALDRLREVIRERDTLYQKSVLPLLDGAVKPIVGIIVALLLVYLLKPSLAWYGRRRFRNAVGIKGFTSGSESGINKTDFAAAVAHMHDRMLLHFRGRILSGTLPMPALVGSQLSEIAELLEDMHSSATPVVKWWSRATRQPAYWISGSIDWTMWRAMVRVKLEHGQSVLGLWNRECEMADLFKTEQDLAYEVLMKVKEHAESNAP